MMKTTSFPIIGARLVFGLFVLIVGILILLQNLDVVNIGTVLSYWPVIFIILGFITYYRHRSIGGIIWGTILIAIGVGILAPKFGIEIDIFDYWPLILVLIGLSMVVNSLRNPSHGNHSLIQEQTSESYVKATTIFGGVRKLVSSKNLLGGDLTTVMGGLQVDLRDAMIQTEAVFDVFVVMGGIEILIPEEWKVVIDALPIFGGVSDSTISTKSEQAKIIKIRGTIILGGTEIKNYSDEDWTRARSKPI